MQRGKKEPSPRCEEGSKFEFGQTKGSKSNQSTDARVGASVEAEVNK